MSALLERDRLVGEIDSCLIAISKLNVELNAAAEEIKAGTIEVAAAYQHAARGTEGEAPEDAEARLEIARSRHSRAENAVEQAYPAERSARGELDELYRTEREVFAEEAEAKTTAFVKWRTRAAASVKKSMTEGRSLELEALQLWNPLSSALRIEPPRMSQVVAIANRATQLAVDVPRPAAIEVDGDAAPVVDAGPVAGEWVWLQWPNGLVDQLLSGHESYRRAVEEDGAEITEAPPGAE